MPYCPAYFAQRTVAAHINILKIAVQEFKIDYAIIHELTSTFLCEYSPIWGKWDCGILYRVMLWGWGV